MNKLLSKAFSSVKVPSKLNFQRDQIPKQVLSVLPSGIQIYTEETAFPFHSDLGICFKAGLRNEKNHEKGSLFSLNQHMFHVTENDCLQNFEQTLRTGAMLDQIYDQELSYWKCSFIQEDLDQIIDVVLRLALSQKVISQETRDQFLSYQQFKAKERLPVDEVIRKAAFGHQPLGNSKVEHQELPSQREFSRFQEEMLTPQNLLIGYSGVWSHEQFRDFIERKLVGHQEFFQRRLRPQEPAKFVSQTFRLNDPLSSDIDIALLFEGCQWNHPNMGVEHVLQQILGSSSSWSSGGPGKGMRSRTTLNLMQLVASVESAAGIKQNYTDTGVFGLRVGGSYLGKSELYESLIKEMRDLNKPISDEEFERGKNIANTLVQMNLERQADRLEESLKTIFLFGENAVDLYKDLISNVTKEQLQDQVKNLINSDITMMYYGKGVEDMPDKEMTLKRIKQ